MKAKFIGKVKDKYSPLTTDLLYEYRGKTYMITAYNNGYSESLATQHQKEQTRIDNEIDNPQPIKPYSDDTEKALDQFFEYCDTGIWKD